MAVSDVATSMKTLKILLSQALLVVLVLYAPLLGSYLADRPLRNSLQLLLFYDDTEYADRYSESRFGMIKPGMSEEQVTDLLGFPLRIIEDCDGRIKRMIEIEGHVREVQFPDLPPHSDCPLTSTIFYYSRPGASSDHWYVRTVRFAPGGMVLNARKSFYTD